MMAAKTAKGKKSVEYVPADEDVQLPEVRKTRQMLTIEAEYGGRDIRFILRDLYNALGSQKAVAERLELEQSTITYWAMRLGIEFTTKPIAIIRTM